MPPMPWRWPSPDGFSVEQEGARRSPETLTYIEIAFEHLSVILSLMM